MNMWRVSGASRPGTQPGPPYRRPFRPTGAVNLTTVPAPARETISSAPPIRSARRRTLASPFPSPSARVSNPLPSSPTRSSSRPLLMKKVISAR